MSDDANIDAYFERIGFSGSIAPTLQTLEILHQLHPAAIPFENLDPLMEVPIRLELRNLEQKLLFEKRGGYCLEQNLLFKAMLEDLAILTNGNLAVLDGKVDSDDNASFRHPELVAMRDIRQEDETEVKASQHDLNYVTMDGNIGCMVNGAGLAMATMDVIKLEGGEPANFLDVGGGASQERVEQAFKILLADPNVKAVLINIFGGIVRCDMIAEGIIAAVKEVGVEVPVIVRLEGTNVEAGKELLKNSGLAITPADDINDGAKKAVAAVSGK